MQKYQDVLITSIPFTHLHFIIKKTKTFFTLKFTQKKLFFFSQTKVVHKQKGSRKASLLHLFRPSLFIFIAKFYIFFI